MERKIGGNILMMNKAGLCDLRPDNVIPLTYQHHFPVLFSNNTYIIDFVGRENKAVAILKYLCENSAMAHNLKELLSARLFQS